MVRYASGQGMDNMAVEYVKLLLDPCAGPLVRSVLPGSGSSYVGRYETDVIFNGAATDVGSLGWFCPGAISSSGLAVGNFSPITSDTTQYTPVAQPAGSGYQPGYSYLSGGSHSARCIAACIQLMWPGSEQSRAGIVAVGQSTLATINGSVSTGQARSYANKVCRTPNGVIEAKLVPNSASENWVDPGAANTAQVVGGMPALFWSCAGFPAATGIRVRFVAVYEWVPAENLFGVSASNPATARSSTTSLGSVLNSMRSYGDWAYSGFTEASQTAASLGNAMYAGRQFMRNFRSAAKAGGVGQGWEL